MRAGRTISDGPGPWAVAMAGFGSLAMALSLGRFVLTPLLPIMLREGTVTLDQGGALATMNYIGYLLGALVSLCIRPDPARMVRASLVLTIAMTLAMALPGGMLFWGAWRFISGICCGFVMVYATAWSQQRLAELGHLKLGGVMFCGPGVGVLLTSVPTFGMTAAHWPASWGWAAFTILGVAMLAPIWRILRSPSRSRRVGRTTGSESSTTESHMTLQLDLEAVAITIIFGLAGFGYIITATFLPVIARHAMPGSTWIELFWPLFGVGVTVGAWLVGRIGLHHDNRHILIVLYTAQAIGVGTAIVSPTVMGFAISSLLVGVPFAAITSIAMREARRLRGSKAVKLIGLMVAIYASGQIAGPPLATALVARTGGFNASLGVAAAALTIGALACLALSLLKPVRDRDIR
ncbi:MFS transporter [Burkholderia anthina]|uniref:MFS transporter n=2 Tax=Burkholderia anthina TaxID=179879 RepID=A0A6P2GA25_9BURK|nr:YbfB/YjiJ family MFS transporter [Burkholderia anthina]VVU50116.1 MFS transporter [Burkholderia anthina]